MTQISLEDEIAVKDLPSEKEWSENYCFNGFDAEKNVGFWLHLGRWSLDPRMWREQLLVYLPDGTFLLRRSFGFRESNRGASGAALDLVCEEPGERWGLKYHGPARKTTSAELRNAPLPDAPQILFDMDVEFKATGDLWDFFGDKKHEGVAFAQHVEQPGTVRGTLRYEGNVIEMNGLGYRDHSRGVRNLTSMYDHCWIHGEFPGEMAFAFFGLRKRREGVIAPEFEMAVVWRDGRMEKAEVDRMPYLSSPTEPSDYHFTLSGSFGEIALEARILRSLPVTLDTRFEFLDGTLRDWGATVAFEQPTSFWWNGRQGTGHTERSTVK